MPADSAWLARPELRLSPGRVGHRTDEPEHDPGGYIGWANLDGSNSASETRAEMNGKCGTRVNDVLGTPGTQTTIAEDWNYRFGIYKNARFQRRTRATCARTSPATRTPRPTGRARCNAYDGSDLGAGSGGANFVTKRASFAPAHPTALSTSCESISGLCLNSFKDLAASGSGPASHGAWGTNRRIVTVPVTDAGNKSIDFACMLMLQPLSIPMADVQLEYIGNAGLPTSPCSFSGMPGGVGRPAGAGTGPIGERP